MEGELGWAGIKENGARASECVYWEEIDLCVLIVHTMN